MICKECGQQLPEGSKFCKNCGARINLPERVHSVGSNSSLISINSDSGEISRDAIVIYLNNMRMVETIIYESERKKEQLKETLRAKEEETNLWEEQKHINSLKCEVSRPINKGVIDIEAVLGWAVIGAIVGFIATLLINFDGDDFLDFIFSIFEGNVLQFLAPCLSGTILCALLGALIMIAVSNKENKSDYKAALAEKHENEILLQQAQDKFERMKTQKLDEYKKMENECTSLIKGLDKDINRFKKLRNAGYGLNLIPYSSNSESNCRCLNGVLFLYEFMSSSRESLTTALGHYKLDKIINRLNDLITAVNQVISNQKYIMVQQEQILDQLERNERLLERNAKHLDRMNDYARISAHNSELQTEMAREALYYQRVDYFLNSRIV